MTPARRRLAAQAAEHLASAGERALARVDIHAAITLLSRATSLMDRENPNRVELLVDLMPADTVVLVLDPERARSRAHDLVATSEEFLGASWAVAGKSTSCTTGSRTSSTWPGA